MRKYLVIVADAVGAHNVVAKVGCATKPIVAHATATTPRRTVLVVLLYVGDIIAPQCRGLERQGM